MNTLCNSTTMCCGGAWLVCQVGNKVHSY